MRRYEKLTLWGVPLGTVSFPHPLAPDICCAQSQAAFRDVEGQRHQFSGSSLSGDPHEAIVASRFEVLERLFASAGFNLKKSSFPKYRLNGDPDGESAAAEVVLRQQRIGGENVTASGVAAHTSAERAIQHGLNELVERHILCNVWYHGYRLKRLDEPSRLGDKLTIATYGLDGQFPFAICTITSDEDSCFLTGSSFSQNLPDAIERARREALQASLNVVIDGLIFATGDWAAQARISTVIGERAVNKRVHFEHLLGARASRSPWRLEGDSLDGLGLDLELASFTALYSAPGLSVVRVHLPGALSKPQARQTEAFQHVEPDPFC